MRSLRLCTTRGRWILAVPESIFEWVALFRRPGYRRHYTMVGPCFLREFKKVSK